MPIASATTGPPTELLFAGVPATAVTGVNLTSFTVSLDVTGPAVVNSGTGAVDTIQLSSSCPLAGTTLVTANAGIATFNDVAFESASASCTLVANDTLSPDTALTASNATVNVSAGTAPHLVYTTLPPTAATYNVALTSFRVSIEDTSGNVMASSSGNVLASSSDTVSLAESGGCVLGGTTSSGATAGVVAFGAVTISSGTSCQLIATDTTTGDTGFGSATSAVIALATVTPTKLGFSTQPQTTVSAGTVLTPFTVAVEESNGIPETSGADATDTIVLSSTSCVLGGTLDVQGSAYRSTFSAVIITKGTVCNIVATDATNPALTAATSSTIALTPGVPTHLAFIVPPPATVTTAGSVLTSFSVAVEDVNGNVETTGIGTNDTVTISSTCTLGGVTSVAAIAGTATFSALTISSTGPCALIATDATRTLTTTSSTTSVGKPQATLTIKTVKGSLGSPLALSTTGGSGTGAVTYTVANGTSTGCTISGSSLRAGKLGTCIVTATKAAAAPYASATSVATTVTFVLPFKATRVSRVVVGTTQNVTITGSGFIGRPRVISNVAGLTATVTRDTGKVLTLHVVVRAGTSKGVRVFTIILGNGKRTSVRFNLS